MMAPPIRRFADLDALSRAAADDLAAIARACAAERGICHIALSGGSTPRRLFQLLVQRGPDALPWRQLAVSSPEYIWAFNVVLPANSASLAPSDRQYPASR